MRKQKKQKVNLKQVGQRKLSPVKNPATPPGASKEMKEKMNDEVKRIVNNQQIDLENRNKELGRTKIALEESNEKYRVLFESFPLGIGITDADGKLIETNKESERLLGIPRDEHNRRKYYGPEWKIIRPDGTPMPSEEYASVRALKENRLVENEEMGIVKSEGEVTWISVTAAPIPLEDYGVAIAYGDITARIRAEAALRESEEKLSHAFHTSPYAITITRIEDGRFIDVNDAFSLITGFTRDEAVNSSSITLDLWANGEDRNHVINELMSGKKVTGQEFQFKKKNGDIITGLFSADVIDLMNGRFILSSISDITDCKRAEEEIRQKNEELAAANARSEEIMRTQDRSRLALLSIIEDEKYARKEIRDGEEKYRIITENISDTVWLMDMDFHATYISPSLEKARGYTLEEIRNMPLERQMTPESFKTAVAVIAEVLTPEHLARKNLAISRTMELEFYRKDGSTFWSEITMSVLRGPDGAPAGLLGSGRDITERRCAEVAMRKSEERYRALVENINDVIYTLDASGVITYASPAVERISHYRVDELIGTLFDKIVYHEDLPGLMADFTNTLAGKIGEYEFRIVDKDGSIRYVRTSSRIIFNDGLVAGVTAIMTDITKRKQAENELKLYYDIQRVLNNLLQVSLQKEPLEETLRKSLELLFSIKWLAKQSRGMILLADENQRTLSIATHYGIEGGLPEMVHRAALPFGSCLCGLAAESKEVVFAESVDERHTERHEGITPHGHYCVPILHEGAVLGVLNLYIEEGHRYDPHEADFLQAVSATMAGSIIRKRAEDRLEELFANLERMVAERTFDLEKANKELESFSYTVSHDLRAPLRHINGFLEMLRKEIGDVANEKAHHFMDVINDSARHMGQLIDDLLAFSRMGRTELSMHTVDMGKLADEVLVGFSDEIGSRALDVVRRPLPAVEGDRAMLRVVLTNLVSNAMKFTSKTTNGKIEIGHDVIDGESVFYVKDNGAGFDMRFVGKLFGVFQRLHSDRDFEGTGIGLATIKSIVQRHGGRVWVEGEVDRGACLYFSLPAALPNLPEGG